MFLTTTSIIDMGPASVFVEHEGYFDRTQQPIPKLVIEKTYYGLTTQEIEGYFVSIKVDKVAKKAIATVTNEKLQVEQATASITCDNAQDFMGSWDKIRFTISLTHTKPLFLGSPFFNVAVTLKRPNDVGNNDDQQKPN